MWIDAHAHLYDLKPDQLALQIENASISGVKIIVGTATAPEHFSVVTNQCDDNPLLFGALGISPFDIHTSNESCYIDLETALTHKKIIAVGEIGIDGSNPRYPPLSTQEPVFERQLAIAKSFGLPAVIHSRGAEERAVAICKNSGISDVLFHCFTGSEHACAAVIDNGYYLSFSGIITFKNAPCANLVHSVPKDRLLIETDSPYLAPVPHRGKINQPAWVHYIGEEVARLFGKTAEDIAMQIENNFKGLFHKYKP